jgi:hypothetical protein
MEEEQMTGVTVRDDSGRYKNQKDGDVEQSKDTTTPTDEAVEEESMQTDGKMKKRADHFRKMITGGKEFGDGLISRLPDDLLLESLIGGSFILEEDNSSGEFSAPVAEDGAALTPKNEWYSSNKHQNTKKARRRYKRTAFHRGEDAIGDTEVLLRILHQCTNDCVLEILKDRRIDQDPRNKERERLRKEKMLSSIIDDVFCQVAMNHTRTHIF